MNEAQRRITDDSIAEAALARVTSGAPDVGALSYSRGDFGSLLSPAPDGLTLSADRTDIGFESAVWVVLTVVSALAFVLLPLATSWSSSTTRWRWGSPEVVVSVIAAVSVGAAVLATYGFWRAMRMLRTGASQTFVIITADELSIVEGNGRRWAYARAHVDTVRLDVASPQASSGPVVATVRVFALVGEHFVRLRVSREHVEPVRAAINQWLASGAGAEASR